MNEIIGTKLMVSTRHETS